MNEEKFKVTPIKHEKGLKVFVLISTVIIIIIGIVLTLYILVD